MRHPDAKVWNFESLIVISLVGSIAILVLGFVIGIIATAALAFVIWLGNRKTANMYSEIFNEVDEREKQGLNDHSSTSVPETEEKLQLTPSGRDLSKIKFERPGRPGWGDNEYNR